MIFDIRSLGVAKWQWHELLDMAQFVDCQSLLSVGSHGVQHRLSFVSSEKCGDRGRNLLDFLNREWQGLLLVALDVGPLLEKVACSSEWTTDVIRCKR